MQLLEGGATSSVAMSCLLQLGGLAWGVDVIGDDTLAGLADVSGCGMAAWGSLGDALHTWQGGRQ